MEISGEYQRVLSPKNIRVLSPKNIREYCHQKIPQSTVTKECLRVRTVIKKYLRVLISKHISEYCHQKIPQSTVIKKYFRVLSPKNTSEYCCQQMFFFPQIMEGCSLLRPLVFPACSCVLSPAEVQLLHSCWLCPPCRADWGCHFPPMAWLEGKLKSSHEPLL